jgi:hypothetical protein
LLIQIPEQFRKAATGQGCVPDGKFQYRFGGSAIESARMALESCEERLVVDMNWNYQKTAGLISKPKYCMLDLSIPGDA